MIPLPSFFIAEHVLWYRDRNSIVTSPMQLLKLIYISHGWMLGIYNKPLIRDRVEAWQYGPVIPDVYHLYKRYGRENIQDGGVDHTEDIGNDDYRKLLEKVLDTYRDYSAIRLSSITHEKGSPWDITVREKGIDAVIDNKLIRQYYMDQFYALQNTS